MLHEVAHIRQANERLLNHELVLLSFALATASVLSWMLLVKLELCDRLPDYLLQCHEKALVDDELCVLWLVD